MVSFRLPHICRFDSKIRTALQALAWPGSRRISNMECDDGRAYRRILPSKPLSVETLRGGECEIEDLRESGLSAIKNAYMHAHYHGNPMSSSIAKSAVRNQLAAMGCDRFEVGILRNSGTMLLRKWAPPQIESALRWLQRENAHGAHIFVRPHGAHALTLVDDLGVQALHEMEQSGFEPAVIVETSPNNFQVWLKHGRVVPDHAVGTFLAKELARSFRGDPSSADWRHFGRLAGFTNQKPARRLESGLAPFVRLRECKGRIYGQAAKFLATAEAITRRVRAQHKARLRSCSASHTHLMRTPCDFHNDPRYGGDFHRADMAWAIYAASRGVALSKIAEEITGARDLSKKGGSRRQLAYAERTAVKAVLAAGAQRTSAEAT